MSLHRVNLAASVDTVSSPAKFVLFCLAWFADDKDHSCSPTLEAIAHWCSMSIQGVLNQLTQLEAMNLIVVVRGVGRSVNRYRVVLNAVEYNGPLVLNTVEHNDDPLYSTPLTTKTTSNYTEDKGTTMSRFKKPDLVEVKFHAEKIGLPESEADKFFNYYESNGWKVGKTQMKQWRSAMANWKINWETWRQKPARFVNSRNPTGSPL